MADKGFPWLNVEFKNQIPKADAPPLLLWGKYTLIGIVALLVLRLLAGLV